MSTLSHSDAARKLLHVAAILATFACVSGASLVASATTSPAGAKVTAASRGTPGSSYVAPAHKAPIASARRRW